MLSIFSNGFFLYEPIPILTKSYERLAHSLRVVYGFVL